MSNQLDILLHPVRMRIVQAFMPDLTWTVQELEKKLDDIPPASLYRHVNTLKKAGLLEVRGQEQVRGTVKKSYGLAKQAFQTPDTDITAISDEENLKYFTAFVTFLQAEYKRYLDQPDKDFVKDGVSFRVTSVYANDEEFHDWIQELRQLMKKITSNKPEKGRKRRTVANIFIPGEEEENEEN